MITAEKWQYESNYHTNEFTDVENTDSSIFWSVFGICYTDVGIGICIWKYRGIVSVSVLPTQAWTSDPPVLLG